MFKEMPKPDLTNPSVVERDVPVTRKERIVNYKQATKEEKEEMSQKLRREGGVPEAERIVVIAQPGTVGILESAFVEIDLDTIPPKIKAVHAEQPKPRTYEPDLGASPDKMLPDMGRYEMITGAELKRVAIVVTEEELIK